MALPGETMRYKVLFAEDDASMRRLIDSWLKKAGFSTVLLESGSDVLGQSRRSRPDLVLMDVSLGDADGRELCKDLRAGRTTKHIPIILISGEKKDLADQVKGLKGGADDYLLKPVTREFLLAKIESVLRRFDAPEELAETLKIYGLELNVTERSVTVGRKPAALTRKEFDLLTVLLRKKGRLLSPQFLLETVWGYDIEAYNDPHTVQVHISRLKRKLGKKFSTHIENVIGSGYRIN